MITSVRNAQVAAARRLQRPAERRAAGLLLAEGPQAVGAALASGRATELFATASGADRHAALVEQAGQIPVRRVSPPVLAALAETRSPQGLVAVARIETPSVDDVGALAPRLAAVLVDVAEPGNVGTIVRTADAAGATAVILVGSSADPWGGKSVRASAGSVFHLPIARCRSLEDAVTPLRCAGLTVVATGVRTGGGLDELALDGPTAWLFGNEANGLPEAARALADGAVRLPVHGRAESLSVAAAAAICLYASAGAQRPAG